MHFIVKVFPEIIIKSQPVRQRFIKQLRDNLRKMLTTLGVQVQVQRDWEKIEITSTIQDKQLTAQVSDLLSRTPGIANFYLVQAYPLGDLQDIYEKTLLHWGDQLAGKSFCVRVKRHGKHNFNSVQIEQFVGGTLLHNTQARCVDLHHPEVLVPLEVKDNRLFVIAEKTQGIGGYPLGTQDGVLSLISGGFDSTVSSYLCMKRGLRTNYCFFNLGGRAHEIGVKEVAYYLWNKFGSSHRVKFVSIPFDEVVKEILEKVDNSYMGVILKRMMLRAATQVAESLELPALVTGESVAQVSSQTLLNLNAIDRVTDMLVLRPLSTMDKGEIIDLSRKIGTETFAAQMPEYCGVISVNPTTRAKLWRVEQEEANFDMDVLARALEQKQSQNIDELIQDLDADLSVTVVQDLPGNAIAIDIRHPDEEENSPLQISSSLLKIPFYLLNKKFPELDQQQTYYLYCQKGVMSQLHAANLKDAGFSNVGVYRPEPKSACAL
jgi:tRNA uracil 4-sulfurtransferase